MTAATTSTRRLVVEVVIGSTAVVATLAVGLLGVGHWLVTVLMYVYPCGETCSVHPSCRLAHPELVKQGWWLMTGVPAICAGAGLLVGALTFVRWRHAITAPVLGLGVAIVAFRIGQPMLEREIVHLVPW